MFNKKRNFVQHSLLVSNEDFVEDQEIYTDEEIAESKEKIDNFEANLDGTNEVIDSTENDLETLELIKDIIEEKDEDGIDKSLGLDAVTITNEALYNIAIRNDFSMEGLILPTAGSVVKNPELSKQLALEGIAFNKISLWKNILEDASSIFTDYADVCKDIKVGVDTSLSEIEDLKTSLKGLKKLDVLEKEMSEEASVEYASYLYVIDGVFNAPFAEKEFDKLIDSIANNKNLISVCGDVITFLKENSNNIDAIGTETYVDLFDNILSNIGGEFESDSSAMSVIKDLNIADFKFDVAITNKIESKLQSDFKDTSNFKRIKYLNAKEIDELLIYNKQLLLLLKEYYSDYDDLVKFSSTMFDVTTDIAKQYGDTITVAKNAGKNILKSAGIGALSGAISGLITSRIAGLSWKNTEYVSGSVSGIVAGLGVVGGVSSSVGRNIYESEQQSNLRNLLHTINQAIRINLIWVPFRLYLISQKINKLCIDSMNNLGS